MKSDFKPQQRRKGRFGKPVKPPLQFVKYPKNWPWDAPVTVIPEDRYRRLDWMAKDKT